MNEEPIEVSGSCQLITVDIRELRLLRELAEAVAKITPVGYMAKLVDALQPWMENYKECKL